MHGGELVKKKLVSQGRRELNKIEGQRLKVIFQYVVSYHPSDRTSLYEEEE